MDAKALGANLQKYRKQKGLTQEAAAEKCGLSANYLRQIELGHKVPKLETFLRIAEVLETSADLLLVGNSNKTASARAGEIYDKIKDLPPSRQEFILKSLDSMIDEIKKM
ncbi:MAG: helix-turn-helix transcriptional regulator [Lachnospiraceae bacterium]|nr:helix-turn-helix transcriptional regulator [Lachnospiraceae bacterium]